MLLLHIIVAFSSIIFASFLLARPSKRKMYGNYAFIAATIVTGINLVVTTHVDILHTCLTGLGYLSIVAILSVLAHYRLPRPATSE